MDIEKAGEAKYAQIKLDEKEALFTESCIEQMSVPLPFLKYEVQYANEYERTSASVQENVEFDFLGTVLVTDPLELDRSGRYNLGEGEIDFYPNEKTTLFDFAKAQDIELKSRSGKHLRTIGFTEFRDEFSGDEAYGYHLSLDGIYLMRDGEDEAYEKTVESDLFVYYHKDDELVMFRKDEAGKIDTLAANNYFAGVGLTDTLESVWERTGEETLIFLDEPARNYLPECAIDYEWKIERQDARRIEFNRIEVYGIRALYTEQSISQASVPKSLHFFEVGNECDHEQGFSKIAKNVHINFSGTLITERSLDLGEDGAIHFAPDELEFTSDKTVSLKEFAREIGIRMKPEKEQVR